MNSLSKVFVAIAGVLVLGVIAFFVLSGGSPDGGSSREKTQAERSAEEGDLKTILSSDSSPGQVYHALIRLSQRGNTKALERALELKDHDRPLLRRGASISFSYFDQDNAFMALQEMTNDSDPAVRSEALKAFSNLKSEGRKNYLLAELETGERTPEEQNAILMALFRMTSDPKERDSLIGRIQKVFENEKSPGVQQQILSTLMTLQPRGEVTLSLLRKALDSSEDERLQVLAIRHLGAIGDESVKRRFDQYMKNPSSRIQIAALGAIHRVCPAGRWAIVEKAITQDQNPSLRQTALRALQMMPGNEAKALVEKFLVQAKEGSDFKTSLNDIAEKIESSRRGDPCLND
jgi:hypothetical protein